MREGSLGYQTVDLEQLLPRLRCPHTHQPLVRDGDALRSADGTSVFPLDDGVVDLRTPPARLKLDLPWYELWDDLERLRFDPPPRLESDDLPYHLDAHLASIPGREGRDRWIVEVGCGERQCEPYFGSRGFHYVGTDVDRRGVGPHLLAEAHNLPFQDGAFDLYTSMAVYEHLAAPLVAALEAFRVLKPGGLVFGTSAFVYGFHDRASFHHMTHAGLLWTLRSAGFEEVRIWPDWFYTQSIPQMAFRGGSGLPWRTATRAFLQTMEWTYTSTSNLVRRLAGKRRLDLPARRAETAGSLSFVARKPEADGPPR